MSSVGRIAGITLLGGALGVLPWAVALAEVGVVTHLGGAVSTYIEQGIVDDPDPISSAWVQYHPADGHRIALNPGGADNGDGDPSLIARQAPGFPIVAWAMNSPEGYDIVVSRFDGTAWTPPQFVADSPADELDPFLVLDPNDQSIHLVYWIHDAAPRVVHRHAPADLSSWSAATPVSHPSDAACRPSAVFHANALHVAYEVHDLGYGTTPRQILLAVHDGQVFSSQMLATTLHADENWPRAHSVGERLWVDWIDAGSEMTWIRKIQAGPWEPVQIEIFQTPEEREFHVRGWIRVQALQ
jgi:hypothetical protein